jgi:phosphoglycolate phosphatase-like HAD superfamily hydrolase
MISHIFFDMYGTLADSARMKPCYSAALGRIMAARFGCSPDAWAAANAQIVADWDSYYADLNLSGDHGIEDLWEGEYRVTRALFRLTATPEPEKSVITALSRELPGLASAACDALFPEVKAVLYELHERGLTLGIASHALETQARGVLEAGGVLDLFTGPIWGVDAAEQFEKDINFYRKLALTAHADPTTCLVVDDLVAPLWAAREAGMQTVHVRRGKVPADGHRSFDDLRDLLNVVNTA